MADKKGSGARAVPKDAYEKALAPEIAPYTKAQVKRFTSKLKALMSQRTAIDKKLQKLANPDSEKRRPTRILGGDV